MDGGENSQDDVVGCSDTNSNTESTSNTDKKIEKVSFWSLVSSVIRYASFGTVKATAKGTLKYRKKNFI